VGSVVTENSPTPVEAPPARRQNTRDKKTTSTPEKPATSKPKPNAVPEASKSEATQGKLPKASCSSKNISGGAMDFAP